MSSKSIVMAAASAVTPTYASDVFSTTTYNGNGGTLTINNGINLSANGGLIWLKNRNTAGISHALFDTQRVNGLTQAWATDTVGTLVAGFAGSVSTTGFSFASSDDRVNALNNNYVSWTFRKKPKFMDIVTYTGNGATQNINHSLGTAPGMILFSPLNDAIANKYVYHSGLGNTTRIAFDIANVATTGSTSWNSTSPTSTQFSIGANGNINTNGLPYEAFLFADDTSPNGLIRCGTFTTDAGGLATISLGWEPQFMIIRAPFVAEAWRVLDTIRGLPHTTANTLVVSPRTLEASDSAVEYGTSLKFAITPDGFGFIGLASTQYIYLAIRRDTKPATSGTQIFKALARTGTGTASYTVSGLPFTPDMAIQNDRSGTLGVYNNSFLDRVRNATEHIQSVNTNIEGGSWGGGHLLTIDGYTGNYASDASWFNVNGRSYIDYFFKRSPGVFDIVCWTGNFTNNRLIAHKLGVLPELVIHKNRSNVTGSWVVAAALLEQNSTVVSAGGNLYPNALLETTGNFFTNNYGTSIYLGSDTAFYVDTSPAPVSLNAFNAPTVTYLFASKAGISKIGLYTGNGTTQTINCNFATGARFILIKRADSTGDWYIWDTIRGIVSANDPHISLNTSVAEVTTNDSIDSDTTGFIVNQVAATNINVTSATYIFLAIA